MTDYPLIQKQAEALREGCFSPISLLANLSALLYHSLHDLNWAGFYLAEGERLLLGPFQGKIACTVIPFGKGVCGTAAASGEVQRVYDVHRYPGHIACDSASNSEIVLPIYRGGKIYGVLDIDSPIIGRFSEEDETGLRTVIKTIEDYLHG